MLTKRSRYLIAIVICRSRGGSVRTIRESPVTLTPETVVTSKFSGVSGPVLVGHIEGKASLVNDNVWTVQDHLEGTTGIWVLAGYMR